MADRFPAGFEPRFEADTFLDHVGPFHHCIGEKSVQFALVVARRHTNPAGTTHGGLLMSMMDVTLGASAARVIGHEGIVATVQMSCNLFAAAREGDLIIGEATVDKVTRTLSFVTGRIRCGDKVLMTASAVFRNPPDSPASRAPAAPQKGNA